MRTIKSSNLGVVNTAVAIEADDIDPKNHASHRYSITVHGDVTVNNLLTFQHGPINEVGINGITNEALLAVVIDRLECFQNSEFKSRENALAITKLEEAMLWLQKRTMDRMSRGVEGTHTK